MIQSVEKIYQETPNGGQNIVYKIIYTDESVWFSPESTDNRHYQEILEWVENGGVIVDNGA